MMVMIQAVESTNSLSSLFYIAALI